MKDFKNWLLVEVFENKDVRSFVNLVEKVIGQVVSQLDNNDIRERLQYQLEIMHGHFILFQNKELNARTTLMFLKQKINFLKDEISYYSQWKNDYADDIALLQSAYDKLNQEFTSHFPLQGMVGISIARDMVMDKIKDRTFKRNTTSYIKHEISDVIDKILQSSGMAKDAHGQSLRLNLSRIGKNITSAKNHKPIIKALKKFLSEDWKFYLDSDLNNREEVMRLGNQLIGLLERSDGVL
jgi:hypothetical protein